MFAQLMKDAAPKAEVLKNATNTVINKVVTSKAVVNTKSLAYRGLVNTVGVGLVLAQPTLAAVAGFAGKQWDRVEELSKEAK